MIVQFSGIRLSLFQMGQLYSCSIVTEIANSNFPRFYLATFPRFLLDCSDFSFSVFSYREKIVHDRLIRIFEKSNFTPKLSVLVFLKVKLPNMTDWHILPGLKIDVLIACCRLPVSPKKPSVAQSTVPVVIYRSLQQT